MAALVLNGSSNPSYTNNSGQNVRIVINYMANPTSISWGGTGVNIGASKLKAIGRNLAFASTNFDNTTNYQYSPAGAIVSNNAAFDTSVFGSPFQVTYNESIALPTELMLAPGQSFGANCGPYNIVVITES